MPAADRRRLHRASRPLHESGLPVRWLPPENYHLTLKFLGEVPPEELDRIRDVVADVAAKSSPFKMRLSGFGAFPSLRRPRVIWVGAEPIPEMRALKHDLEWELASLGFERELRAFHPHVTIGRATPESRAGSFRDLEDMVAQLQFQATISLKSVELMRSRLLRGDADYEAVARLPLAGTAARSQRSGGAA